MKDPQMLRAVHAIAESAALQHTLVDVYAEADALCRRHPASGVSRRAAVDTMIAACVVYGAPMSIDPQARPERAPAASAPVAA